MKPEELITIILSRLDKDQNVLNEISTRINSGDSSENNINSIINLLTKHTTNSLVYSQLLLMIKPPKQNEHN